MPARQQQLLATTLVALAALCAGCGAQSGEGPPGVVLILVDTLRADVLGCYGGDPRVSPNIDALAARGVLFESMQAAAPWTGPSVASVLTGRYPDEIGIHELTDPLPAAVPTLAQRFRTAGYRTGAVISNNIAGPDFGYGKGYDALRFERYKHREGPLEGHPSYTADRVTDDALAVLDELGGTDRPFFLYVHYTDPHEPYLPPEPYRTTWAGEHEPMPDAWFARMAYTKRRPTQAQVELMRARYRGEVAFADAEIGRLLEALPEDTTVVLTADHGEEFLEHGRFQHGHSLYQELVHVPLIVAGPGIQKGVRQGDFVVSHADIAPSLVELAGLEADASAFSGMSWLGFVPGAPPRQLDPSASTVHSVMEHEQQELLASTQRFGPLKLIRDGVRADDQLYDLAGDPGEHDDLAGDRDRAADLSALGATIEARRAAIRADWSSEVDPEAAAARDAELRSIGYK